MKELPYAEDIKHYWQTGKSSPDVWIARAKQIIEDLGGEILTEAFGLRGDKAAFMLSFKFDNNDFKVIWPVLPSRTNKATAAKIQAATLLYHDIKAKAMTASILGIDTAFFSYMMLPDGRVTSEMAKPELAQAFPLQLKQGE